MIARRPVCLFGLFMIFLLPVSLNSWAGPGLDSLPFTHADTLRGSNGPGRSWWNVLRYDITVEPDYGRQFINGTCIMTVSLLKDMPATEAQVDLQTPMELSAVTVDYAPATFRRDGNAYFITFPAATRGQLHSIRCEFRGKPRKAVTPPWDGGWIWAKDKAGNPWMSVACQGLGASVWYPCKDIQSDEPDSGAMLRIIVPDSLTAVGNGRLESVQKLNNDRTQYNWKVRNPINNYNIVPYIGKYSHFNEVYNGEKGPLDLDYWVMTYNKDKAVKQFADVTRMLRAFEYWFGPYPFYEDGYKLVEAPHLGMEHQSAIAYGNGYQNGYRGSDLSSTGWGLKWDFIIVHESGHEWFANSITTADIADMWVHEGFTNYSETLFTDYYYGKQAGTEYVAGIRKQIENDIPIIGPYGVNKEGSGDMYYKGGNMIHYIRQVIGDDETFRKLLRKVNSEFYHRIVTTEDIETFISKESGISFHSLFDQYLRTTKIPVLQWAKTKNSIRYRWDNVVDGYDMPVQVSTDSATGTMRWIKPTAKWKKIKLKKSDALTAQLFGDKNFYIKTEEIKKP